MPEVWQGPISTMSRSGHLRSVVQAWSRRRPPAGRPASRATDPRFDAGTGTGLAFQYPPPFRQLFFYALLYSDDPWKRRRNLITNGFRPAVVPHWRGNPQTGARSPKTLSPSGKNTRPWRSEAFPQLPTTSTTLSGLIAAHSVRRSRDCPARCGEPLLLKLADSQWR